MPQFWSQAQLDTATLVKIRNLFPSDDTWTEGYVDKYYVLPLVLERFQHDAVERKMIFFDNLLDLDRKLNPASVCTSKFRLIDTPPAQPTALSRFKLKSKETAIKKWLEVSLLLMLSDVLSGMYFVGFDLVGFLSLVLSVSSWRDIV